MRKKRLSRTRVIGYDVEWPEDGPCFKYAVRDLLSKLEGVTQFGSDSRFVWFNGPPGKNMRAAKKAVLKLTCGKAVRRYA